ncbi:MAG TPA: Ig-like domain-containing protein [Gemmatimonadales bacterium]|nr:Ig-like domain-containing protein [Gemmatimonadales bacterium]
MTALSRFHLASLAGAISLAVACGGKNSTGLSAASVTGIAGDSQVASAGTQLPFPLSFVVLSASGQPLPGVSVTWTATPAAGATFAPSVSTTDAQGTAATTVTLGGIIGDVVIRANVTGIQPVVFHALVIDPCAYAASYTIGATVNAALTTSDCKFGGNYYTDFYIFTITSQQGVTATETAPSFDAWLDVFRASGPQMAFANDIAPGNTNARVQMILAPGTYVLAPNSRLEFATGPYTLTSAVRAQTVAGCNEAIWITRGVTITDNIATTDCPDSTTTPVSYRDELGIIAFATLGDTLRFTQHSAAFDPKLKLFRIQRDTGYVLAASNNGTTTTDAVIDFPVVVTAVYVVSPGTVVAGATGAYTLVAGGSVSLGPGPRATAGWGRGREPLPFAPLPLPEARQLPGLRRHD